MVDEFPSNSHTKREARTTPVAANGPKDAPAPKEIKTVATGKVIRRKRPVGKKFKDFVSGMHIRTASRDVATNVMLPAARDMIAHAGTTLWEQMIFGEARYRPRGPMRGPTRYDAMSQGRSAAPQGWTPARPDPRRDISPRARETHNFDEILLESRGEAEAVIDQLMELLSTYGQASVADLYAMVSMTSDYPDRQYGWTDLRGASAQLSRGAYLLNLPKPELLDR